MYNRWNHAKQQIGNNVYSSTKQSRYQVSLKSESRQDHYARTWTWQVAIWLHAATFYDLTLHLIGVRCTPLLDVWWASTLIFYFIYNVQKYFKTIESPGDTLAAQQLVAEVRQDGRLLRRIQRREWNELQPLGHLPTHTDIISLLLTNYYFTKKQSEMK